MGLFWWIIACYYYSLEFGDIKDISLLHYITISETFY